MTSGTDPVLDVSHVTKRYFGLTAVEDGSFDLFPGEILSVVGANGAGKSTLMKMVAGAVQPDSGTISVAGQQIHPVSVGNMRRAGIEMVYQDLALVRNMDAAFNLFLGRIPTKYRFFVDRRKMLERTRTVLDTLQISTLQDLSVPVESLSGGQRQALAIGRAFESARKIAIFDEPVAALGVAESEEVIRLIYRLRDAGTAVMVVTHDMEHVMRISDRVLVVRNGRTLAQVQKDSTTVDEVIHMMLAGAL